MASELVQAIEQVCSDKNIPVASVVETIESALAAAYRKDFGNKMQNIKVEFDMETGDFKVYDIKEVVEDELRDQYEKIKEERIKEAELAEKEGREPEYRKEEEDFEESEDGEEIKKFNPKTMIALSDAKEIKKSSKLGDELVQKLTVEGDFGRMAAQTAKQVIIQKLREAERNTIMEEYKDKIGELIVGTVQRQEGRVILVDFGNTTAVMPIEESVRGEKYIPGARFKFYLKSVEQSNRGPKVIISRTHPEILRKLFKLEVPEIASGTVQIKSIAREAGSRSKIAVEAKEENIDPIGSCVGQRGTRVQTIINELGGEKIDSIEWEEDPKKYISKALAPAKVLGVEILGEEKKKSEEEEGEQRQARVKVDSDQLSLAIGKAGQNVRLAAKLTGWKIDIIEEKPDGTEEEVKVEETADSKEVKEDKKEVKESSSAKSSDEDKEEKVEEKKLQSSDGAEEEKVEKIEEKKEDKK